VAQRPSTTLLRFAPVIPDRRRARIVTAAYARAITCGLSLPIVLARFVAAPRTEIRGEASSMYADLARITLRADLSLGEIPYVALHELQHCADLHAGLFATLTVGELERRALTFGIRATDGWELP